MSNTVSQPAIWPEGQLKSHRVTWLIAFPLIAFVSFRKLILAYGDPAFPAAVLLLGAFTLLFLTQPWLSYRYPRYRPLYLLAQAVIVESLGMLRPYEDTWGLLYIILGAQVFYLLPSRAARAWAAAFAIALLVTMVATRGLLPGLGYSLLTIALTVFFSGYDLLYTQAEATKQESQRLLEELQAAHSRLKDYAAQAEALAVAQEHDRLIRELHDSVSQMIFSISLATESTRLLLVKDPARVPAALGRLQELTGQALSQMRTLISQWRPGPD